MIPNRRIVSIATIKKPIPMTRALSADIDPFQCVVGAAGRPGFEHERPRVTDDVDPDRETTYSVRLSEDKGRRRLDRALADALPDLSRSRVKALILGGAVSDASGFVLADPSKKVPGGVALEVRAPEPEAVVPEPENIPLDVLHEDDDVIVIDKPAGLVVHPAAGNPTGTLVNALLHRCGDGLSGIGAAAVRESSTGWIRILPA